MTIANIAGVSTTEIHNSQSFHPLLTSSDVEKKEFVYTEISNNGLGYAIRNANYKLIVYENGTEEFYNLAIDAYENSNLTGTALSAEALTAKEVLKAEAIRIHL